MTADEMLGGKDRDVVKPRPAPVSEEQKLLGRLDKIRNANPTGGLRILDCAHGFRELLIIYVPSVVPRWHLIMAANVKCHKCDTSGGNVISHRVDFCPHCGIKLDGNAPIRNYVIGQNVSVDLHLLRHGGFEMFEKNL